MGVVTVLVADSQLLFADALAQALGAEDGIAVVDERPDRGPSTLDAVARLRPDVVIYDDSMLGLDGPAATKAIASFAPQAKVLVSSWFHSSDQIRATLRAGAAGFVPKSLRLAQLVHAVRQAAAGQPLVFGDQLAGLIEDLEGRWDESVSRYERLSSLTSRELQVLQVLAEGRALPEVAEELSISLGTLRNHVHKSLAKTGARTHVEAVAMARAAGFLSWSGRRRDARANSSGPLGEAARPVVPASRPRGGGISVLVADAQRLFADAIASCLEQASGVSVIDASTSRAGEAIDAVMSFGPDVVVYDLHLRDMEGTTAVRALSRWAPSTRIILVSWYNGRPQVRRALAAAPDIVVPKTVPVARLVEAVRLAGERDAAAHAAELLTVLDLLDGGRPGNNALEQILSLTPREVQVLQHLAKGRPVKETAAELYLAVGTVKNLTSRLMSKLGVGSQLEAVTMAGEAGFLW